MANLAIRLANSGEKLKRKRPHREMSRFLFLPASPSEGPPIGRALINAPCVCFSAQTGKHLLVLSLTAFDPKRPKCRSGATRARAHFPSQVPLT